MEATTDHETAVAQEPKVSQPEQRLRVIALAREAFARSVESGNRYTLRQRNYYLSVVVNNPLIKE